MADFKKPWERGSFRSGDDAPRPPRKGGFRKPRERDGEDRPSRGGFRKPWERDGGGGSEDRAPSRPRGFRKPWERDGGDDSEGRAPSRPRGGFRKPWERDGGEGSEGRAPSRPFRSAGDRPGFRGSFRRDKPWDRDGDRPARGGFRKPGFRKPWEDRAPAEEGEGAKPWALPRKDRAEGDEAPRPARKRAAPSSSSSSRTA